jgi:threonine dehydratase
MGPMNDERPPEIPDIAAIRAAARRIAPHAHRTPVLTCGSLDARVGSRLFFKCENFQKVGAFKFRGACNAVLSLSEDQARHGVATHSSGNHAQALALAARIRGVVAHIVMPESSPRAKVAAVRGYGGRIVFCPPTQEDRERTLESVVAETGAAFVHPYNDPRVVAGQATCAVELIEEVPDLDLVLAPVGGGGLVSGTALACAALSTRTRVLAVEPAAADDTFRSFRDGRIYAAGSPRTVADGLRTSLGSLTFAIIRARVSAVVTVAETSIIDAMRLIWERMKLVVEPSAAVPLAALLEGLPEAHQRRVGIILSGGNLDLDRLPWGRREGKAPAP